MVLIVGKALVDLGSRELWEALSRSVDLALEVGKGKITVDDYRQIIEKKDRGVAGASAPAQGLFLSGIEYPEKLVKF